MKITLDVHKIINTICDTSHSEVETLIDDIEQRYKSEAGSEKMNLILRSLTSAYNEAVLMCDKFLVPDESCIGDNGVMTENSIIVLEFINSERRFLNKAIPLASALHDVIVDLTLQKFYKKVGNIDLAKVHEDSSAESILNLETCLYTKRPPRTRIN